MIASLFSYKREVLPIFGDYVTTYEDVATRVQIGTHRPGTCFDEAEVNYCDGTLAFIDDDETVSNHTLSLSVDSDKESC